MFTKMRIWYEYSVEYFGFCALEQARLRDKAPMCAWHGSTKHTNFAERQKLDEALLAAAYDAHAQKDYGKYLRVSLWCFPLEKSEPLVVALVANGS